MISTVTDSVKGCKFGGKLLLQVQMSIVGSSSSRSSYMAATATQHPLLFGRPCLVGSRMLQHVSDSPHTPMIRPGLTLGLEPGSNLC